MDCPINPAANIQFFQPRRKGKKNNLHDTHAETRQNFRKTGAKDMCTKNNPYLQSEDRDIQAGDMYL